MAVSMTPKTQEGYFEKDLHTAVNVNKYYFGLYIRI